MLLRNLSVVQVCDSVMMPYMLSVMGNVHVAISNLHIMGVMSGVSLVKINTCAHTCQWVGMGCDDYHGGQVSWGHHTLQWRYNERNGISNLNCLFRCRSKKISKLRNTVLCAGNSPVTGEFPAQMASNAENWIDHSLHLGMDSLQTDLGSLCGFMDLWYVFWEYLESNGHKIVIMHCTVFLVCIPDPCIFLVITREPGPCLHTGVMVEYTAPGLKKIFWNLRHWWSTHRYSSFGIVLTCMAKGMGKCKKKISNGVMTFLHLASDIFDADK